MPTNVTVEYAKARQRFIEARTREEKIAALEEMLSTIPKHKGTEHVQAEIKAKLAKLRRQTVSKAGRFAVNIPKEGDVQVCILGLTQSGKSSLLAKLTNARPKISSIPYTTIKPEVGIAEWKGVKFQLIEIPSTFERVYMSIAQNSDGLILLYGIQEDLNLQKEKLAEIAEKFRLNKPSVEISGEVDAENLFEALWKNFGLIRIYTKEPGKPAEKKALVLKKNANVRDAARRLHADFLKFFKFAKVWGASTKYQGERVGLEHKLKDGDVLEIRI